ncbi:MAG: type II secretion system GspH family protein, partial [Gammaproteobacteria bacterium]|nr:type II secretion system GspH family protein [Gammaproteobacteria bacterium]
MLIPKLATSSPFTSASPTSFRLKTSSRQTGFTLIELVVGIVVLGIALLMISS